MGPVWLDRVRQRRWLVGPPLGGTGWAVLSLRCRLKAELRTPAIARNSVGCNSLEFFLSPPLTLPRTGGGEPAGQPSWSSTFLAGPTNFATALQPGKCHLVLNQAVSELIENG